MNTADGVRYQIWAWLPGRTDGRRITTAAAIAFALDLSMTVVTAALAEMEHSGYAIRDRAVGRQSGWHRGKPLPQPPTQPPAEEWTLY